MLFRPIILLAILSQDSFAASCMSVPGEDSVRCGSGAGTSHQTQQQHAIFLETLALTQSDPEFSGIVSAVRVNTEWAIVDRSKEKPEAPKPTESTLGKIMSLGARALGISASFSFTYKTTTYDSKGRPITTSIDINAGAATGGAAEAQRAMNEAMQKNKK